MDSNTMNTSSMTTSRSANTAGDVGVEETRTR
jgi:hypothetical protein